MLHVRLAELDDLSSVHCLDPLSLDRLRAKANRAELLVAVKREEIIGSLRFGYIWDDSPFIHQIVVAEQARGRGVGTKMLRFLEAMLFDAGYGLLLSSSECAEGRAQHWHRRSGFDEVGIIAGLNEGGVGEVFFSKTLEPVCLANQA